MFFILSKTFDVLMMPLTMVFVAVIYALITKNRARSRKIIIGALIGLYLMSNDVLVNGLLKRWEPTPILPAKTYEVGVILLGGTVKKYDTLSHNLWLGESGDRGIQALNLYKSGKIKKIIISGGETSLITGQLHSSENDGIRHLLVSAGVPESDIIQEGRSKNTRENATFSAQILRKQFGLKQCIIITSAFHMRRAIGCFEKAGLDVIPFPAHYLQTKSEPWFDQLFPSEKSLAMFTLVWHEMIGYVVYRAVGYI